MERKWEFRRERPVRVGAGELGTQERGPPCAQSRGLRSGSEQKPLQVSLASGAVVESASWSRVSGSVNVTEVTPGLRIECGPVCWTMDQALRPPAMEG